VNESYRTARPAATSKAPGRGKTVPAQARAPGAKIDFEAIKASVNFRAIVERELALPNGLGNGGCACPFHEDSANPTSFSVRGQKAHCFSCDWSGDVIDFIAQCRSITKAEAARELDTRALRNGQAPGGRAPGGAEGKPKGKGGGYAYKSYEAALEAVQQHKWDGPERWVEREALGKPVESYPYPAPNGRIGAYVLRFERMKDGKRQKTFRPISLHSEGWRIKDPPGKWWPLDANTIAAADTVPLCEGEKCVRIFQRIGFTATTAAHGAQSPELTDWTPLAGKTVPLFPDVGKAGDDWLGKVIPLLLALDPKPIIKVIRLPGFTEDGDDIEQWEALHDSWDAEQLQAELERLIREAPEWTPPPAPPAESIGALATTRLSSIKASPLRWLVPGYLPKGKLVVVAGEGGTGKSTLTLEMAARISQGEPCFGLDYKTETAEVLLIACEDSFSDTVVPYLTAAGADLDKIRKVDGITGADGKLTPFGFSHYAALEADLARNPKTSLVISTVRLTLSGFDATLFLKVG
jgi:AAA domain/CHC2 zinc finger